MAAIDKPALEGGDPVRSTVLPYATQSIGREEIEAVVETLKSVWITTGPREKEFSEKFAAYVGSKHAVAVNSCTSALNVSVVALGIGPGDEVITTPLTFVATTFAVIHAGATPVFADIRPDTFNIDPAEIEQKITPRTKAILPMHYGGTPVDLDPILAIAKKHKLKVIEDAAHASGAEYKGRKIGTFGDFTCFSFHAIKNMTSAEGGMITTADPEMASLLKALVFFGIPMDAYKRSTSPNPWHYDVEHLGYKYNMPDISAALGMVQLEKLDRFNARRAELTRMYNEAFSGMEEIITPVVTEGAKSSHHLYVIRIREEMMRVGRDHLLAALRAENIFANIHYTPIYRHPYFVKTMNLDPALFPACEAVASSIITLPLFPAMADEDLRSVVEAMSKIVKYYRK